MVLFQNPEILVNEAERLAKKLVGKVKTHQMRRIYERVQAIYEHGEDLERARETEEDISTIIEKDIKLLKPQLAYAVSRKPELKPLYEDLLGKINKINNSWSRFKEFYDFFHSLMCYYQYYGRDKKGE